MSSFWQSDDWKKNWTNDKMVNSGLGMLSGASSITSNVLNMANPDIKKITDSTNKEIDDLISGKTTIDPKSYDDLMNQIVQTKYFDTNVNADDYYVGPDNGEIASNTIKNTLSGAASGAALGPIGAIVGGVVGLGSSLWSGLTGKNKAEDAAKELADKKRQALIDYNNYQHSMLDTAIQNTTEYNNRLLESKIIADGGSLNTENNIISNETIMKHNLPIYAYGGTMPGYGGTWSNGLNFINTGNSHEQNPLGGVPMGISQEGMPNLVEEGEVVWNDYVFSNRMKVPKKVKDKYNLSKNSDITFADAVKKIQKSSSERPNDPIENRGLNKILTELMYEQESLRQKKYEQEQFNQNEDMAAYAADGGPIHIAKNKRGTFTAAATKHDMGVQEFANHVLSNKEDYSPAMVKKAVFAHNAKSWNHAYGGPLGKYFEGDGDEINNLSNPLPVKGWDTSLRYAPVIGNLGTVASDLIGWTNKPDYKYADALDRAANTAASKFNHVSYTPLGDYMSYTPFDRMYYSNQLAQQANATRRNILNNSNGNRSAAIASLLMSDYNAQNALGNLYKNSEEYNLEQRQKIADFNRETNRFNSQQDLQTQATNAEIDKAKANLLYESAVKSNLMRQQEDQTANAAKAVNINNLIDNLGNLGIDAYNRYDRNALINSGVFGVLSQKPQGVSNSDWEAYKRVVTSNASK